MTVLYFPVSTPDTNWPGRCWSCDHTGGGGGGGGCGVGGALLTYMVELWYSEYTVVRADVESGV